MGELVGKLKMDEEGFFIVERQQVRGEGTGVDIATIKTNFPQTVRSLNGKQ